VVEPLAVRAQLKTTQDGPEGANGAARRRSPVVIEAAGWRPFRGGRSEEESSGGGAARRRSPVVVEPLAVRAQLKTTQDGPEGANGAAGGSVQRASKPLERRSQSR
jgi:hypothetical protein